MKNLFLKLISFTLIVVSMVSCNNDTITVKQAGSISLKIKGTTEGSIDSVSLALFDISIFKTSITSSQFSSLDEYAVKLIKETNSNTFDFGEVNSGNYLILGEILDSVNRSYNVNLLVQVVAGTTNSKTIDLAEYLGTLKLRIIYEDNYISRNINQMNILLVPDRIPNVKNMDMATLREVGIELGKTNEDGLIFADNIPARGYYIIGYYDDESFDFLSFTNYNSIINISVEKNTVINAVLYSDIYYSSPSSSDDSATGIHVYSIHYDKETEVSDTSNITGANVILCTSNNPYLSWAINDAECHLITNEDGIASLPEGYQLSNNRYYIWVYINENIYAQSGPYSAEDIKHSTINLNVPYSKFYSEYGNVNIDIFTAFSDSSLNSTISPFAQGNILLTKTTSNTLPTGITAMTDNNGRVTFNNVPVGNYFLWGYTDSEHAERSSTVVTVKANETSYIKDTLTSEKILKLKSNLYLKIVNAENKGLKNINVVLCKKYYSDIKTAIAYASATEKTDNYGYVNFEDLDVGAKYYAYLYYDLNQYYRNSYFNFTIKYHSDERHTINTGNEF